MPMPMTTRLARALGVAALAAMMLPAAVLAAPPQHSPTDVPPTVLDAGAPCRDAMRFENLELNGKDTAFAPAPSGSQRFLSRGSGVSRVTDLDNGNVYDFRGGVRILVTVAPDGSVRADASGRDYIAFYLPGDDSTVGPGLFQMSGHLTEWYAPDGSFLRAEFHGTAVNLCEVLEG
jgi:hypothetical protein